MSPVTWHFDIPAREDKGVVGTEGDIVNCESDPGKLGSLSVSSYSPYSYEGSSLCLSGASNVPLGLRGCGFLSGLRPRLSSLCSFRTLYFTPESGPATEGFSCRGAVMNDEGNAARKIRKLRASRDLWKQRSAEKQQEIRQLRVTVRDLSSSRENWKTRVKELEQQLQAAHEAHAAVGPGSWIFFGGLMDNQAMPRTRRTPITLSSD